MQEVFNNFLCSDLFDKLPLFLKKKFRKISNSYFCITNKNKLPKKNYTAKFSGKYQQFIIDNFKSTNYVSKNSFNNLKKILLKKKLKKINLLDFGAGDINTYLEIRNIKNLEYFYFDLPDRNKIINKITKRNNFRNINVINNFNFTKNKFNFAFFGSSIGYSNNYENILDKITKVNCKYVLFSGITFFQNNKTRDKYVVAKQLNIIPKINFVFFFNKKVFINFFKKKKYKIIFCKKNQFKKISYKNLLFFSKKIEYCDIFFEKE